MQGGELFHFPNKKEDTEADADHIYFNNHKNTP
jgi:hypothetical protein